MATKNKTDNANADIPLEVIVEKPDKASKSEEEVNKETSIISFPQKISDMEENICAICLDSDQASETVTTPCNHIFHKDCIKQLNEPKCPLCKRLLVEFLLSLGLSLRELADRVEGINDNDDNDDYNDDDYNYDLLDLTRLLSETDDNDSDNDSDSDSDDDFFRIYRSESEAEAEAFMTCFGAMKKSNAEDSWLWSTLYRDILIDMISNARDMFAEISAIETKKHKEIGAFTYKFEVKEFISMMLDERSPSVCEWQPKSELDKLGFNEALTAIDEIKNPKTDFAVIFIIHYKKQARVHSRLMSTNQAMINKYISEANKRIVDAGGDPNNSYLAGITRDRVDYQSLLMTLRLCKTVRKFGGQKNHNREYSWAKDMLKRLRRKNKKGKNALS